MTIKFTHGTFTVNVNETYKQTNKINKQLTAADPGTEPPLKASTVNV